ncbi:MAG TPA: CHAP domain-containing protein [Mucilaginibacter sp.]|nr:CHAP domain-containing protein [Mucilaginibacter sp.]
MENENLALLALNIAGTQVGVKEATGHNDGPAVEKYLKSVGLGKGYPWCMAFVYWCCREAARELNISNPLKCTGGVQDQWDSWKGEKAVTPRAGDICIMHHAGGWHTGIVSGYFQDGRIHLIEGNTNDNGSREGVEVMRKWRHIDDHSMVGFIRL